MAEKNLKIPITAETSGFKKGMKDAKKALNDFKNEGTGALNDIASLLGIDSKALDTFCSKLGQSANLFKTLGSTGENASKAMTLGMKALGASIASLGIMAAVAAFKELNAEAKNFEERLQGVNLAASAQAARSTYRQAMYDASGAGEAWAKFSEGFRTTMSRGWTNLVTGILGGTGEADWADADRKAERAAQLASDMVEYKREERSLGIEIQRIDNQILEAQAKFKNNQLSATERKQAEATITELINQKYDKQIDLQQRITNNIKERNSLTSSSEGELDKEAEAEKKLLSLEGQRQQEKNSLLRTSNSITGAMQKQAKAAEEIESTLERIVGKGLAEELNAAIGAEILQNDVAVQRIFNEGDLAMLRNVPGLQGQAERLKVPVALVPQVDTEAAQKAVIELADVIESGVVGMSEALGDLIGDLINGENAWGNFAQAGISVVADMLSTVGKAFIAEGLGVIAAQTALVTGGGAGAVAAGAAMVALAATMKAAMSNAAASWSGGYSTSVASSAYTSGAVGMSTFGREMEVKVTGTLTANGSKLVAVLNNESNRNNYTT